MAIVGCHQENFSLFYHISMSEFSELAWDVINIKGAVDPNDIIHAPTTPEVAIATFKEFILSRPDVGRICLPFFSTGT